MPIPAYMVTYMSTMEKLTKISFNKRVESSLCSDYCIKKKHLQDYKGAYLFFSHLSFLLRDTHFFEKGIFLSCTFANMP